MTEVTNELLLETLKRMNRTALKRPSATVLFKTQLEAWATGLGEATFYSTSGVAHGRPTAIRREYDDDSLGFAGLAPSKATAYVVYSLSFAALDALARASGRYFGWSVNGWINAFDETKAEVRAADAAAREAVRQELGLRRQVADTRS